MDKKFAARGFFEVPDGTDVSPFLNATDVKQSDVRWALLGDMSIAAGRIKPGIVSWIHIHPAVTQVTYLVSGDLTIRMQDGPAAKRYELHLEAGEAVVLEPGTLFQLDNHSGAEVAEVLYIVSPSYVFDMEGDEIVYDDAILVAESWEELVSNGYDAPALAVTPAEQIEKRLRAMERLERKKDQR